LRQQFVGELVAITFAIDCRPVVQFGMIFILPRFFGGAQCIGLLAVLDFVTSYLGQERTSAPFAN
jgi:hypothetical protein